MGTKSARRFYIWSGLSAPSTETPMSYPLLEDSLFPSHAGAGSTQGQNVRLAFGATIRRQSHSASVRTSDTIAIALTTTNAQHVTGKLELQGRTEL